MADTALTTIEQRESEKFAVSIAAQMKGASTSIQLSEHQQRLAKRLWLQCDLTLRDLEQKRQGNKFKQDAAPIVWENIDREQLAIDAWKRIDLGLDALIPNHIHPIPYWNNHKKKYDLNLQIGYAGKDYYKRQAAVEKPLNIQYELVYDTDTFAPTMSSSGEGYEFKINKPFNRGNVIGGFGYIQYKDQRKNKLVIVSKKDFDTAHTASKSKGENDFYEKHPLQMDMVVVVRKTTRELAVDPKKMSEAYREVEKEETEELPLIEDGDVIEGQSRDISDATELPPSDAGSPAVAPEAPAAEETPAEATTPQFPKLLAKYPDCFVDCPEHKTKWFVGQWGLFHKDKDINCKFKGWLRPIVDELATAKGGDTNDICKEKYGVTWSQIKDEQCAQVAEDLL